VRKKYSKKNMSSLGGYEILRSRKKIDLAILASGSEVEIAVDVCHKLAIQNTHSKVISMPCKEIFDKQIKSYKNKILNEARFVISIEAGSTTGWKKYVGNKGICFGLNT
jgi:transketolase